MAVARTLLFAIAIFHTAPNRIKGFAVSPESHSTSNQVWVIKKHPNCNYVASLEKTIKKEEKNMLSELG